MSQRFADHLSPDDIDAYLEGRLAHERQQHLEGCVLCSEFARLERGVAEQLAELPGFQPSAEFPEHVMAAVHLPDPFALRAMAGWRARLLGGRSLAAAATILVTVLGIAGSAAWTLANRDVLLGLGRWATAQAYQGGWLALRTVASTVIGQPWYADAQWLFASPSRLALGSAALSLLYVTGVLALRRLLAVPAQRVADAIA
jgi:hypothetical protein